MSEPIPPPAGFSVGHWTDAEGMTGCTVLLAPPGARCGVDVRGGGPGTRETDVVGALAGTAEVTAVMLSGGSAYGLATADGAMRWLERAERGYATPAGLVPIVPTAVIYDLAVGDPAARPDAEAGYAACEAARPGVPQRGLVGAGTGALQGGQTLAVSGTGAAVGKLDGRAGSTRTGVGYAAARSGRGETVAAVAVANAFGDVIGEDGRVLAGIRRGVAGAEAGVGEATGAQAAVGEAAGAKAGTAGSTAALIAEMAEPPDWSQVEARNTTLVCVLTDAALDKAACSRVARMASGGVARAVDPVFSEVDGDVAFCVASGEPARSDRFTALAIGTIAATVTAAAIRDAALAR